jgi:hypothetical protein
MSDASTPTTSMQTGRSENHSKLWTASRPSHRTPAILSPPHQSHIGPASPLAFEITRGRQHSHRLVHDPLANAEIVIDPFLEVFVIGDLVSVETRAVRTPRGPDQDAGKQISFSPSTPSPPTGPFAFKSSRVQGIFTLNQSSA